MRLSFTKWVGKPNPSWNQKVVSVMKSDTIVKTVKPDRKEGAQKREVSSWVSASQGTQMMSVGSDSDSSLGFPPPRRQLLHGREWGWEAGHPNLICFTGTVGQLSLCRRACCKCYRKLQSRVILQVCQQLELIGFWICSFQSCVRPALDIIVQDLFGGGIPVSNF